MVAGLDDRSYPRAMSNQARNDKRDLILAKGAQVMTRRGYHGTGVLKIVQAAGIPKGSFYHYILVSTHQTIPGIGINIIWKKIHMSMHILLIVYILLYYYYYYHYDR